MTEWNFHRLIDRVDGELNSLNRRSQDISTDQTTSGLNWLHLRDGQPYVLFVPCSDYSQFETESLWNQCSHVCVRVLSVFIIKDNGKNKNYCSKCEDRHYSPTGKKCQKKFSSDSDEGNSTAQTKKVYPSKKSKNCQLSKHIKARPVSPHGQPPVTHKKDLYVKPPMAKHLGDSSDSGEDSSLSDDGDQNQQTVLQMKILTWRTRWRLVTRRRGNTGLS